MNDRDESTDLWAEVVAAVATRGVVSDGRKAVIPGDRT